MGNAGFVVRRAPTWMVVTGPLFVPWAWLIVVCSVDVPPEAALAGIVLMGAAALMGAWFQERVFSPAVMRYRALTVEEARVRMGLPADGRFSHAQPPSTPS